MLYSEAGDLGLNILYHDGAYSLLRRWSVCSALYNFDIPCYLLWPQLVPLSLISHLLSLPQTAVLYLIFNHTLNQSSQWNYISLPSNVSGRLLSNNVSIDSTRRIGYFRLLPALGCRHLDLASLSAFPPAANCRKEQDKKKNVIVFLRRWDKTTGAKTGPGSLLALPPNWGSVHHFAYRQQ